MFNNPLQIFFGLNRASKSSTVRRAFPLAFIAFVVAGAAVITSETNVSQVTLDIEPDIVREGEEFFINVTADAHTPTNTIDIEIAYPKSQIEIQGIDVGESVISLWTQEPHWENGKVYFKGGVFRKGFVGEHLIARIRASGKVRGTAVVSTSDARFLAGDGKGTEVALADTTDDTSKVYISDGSPEDLKKGANFIGRFAIGVVTDLDGDGEVSIKDISRFMAAWRTKAQIFDFNGDGKMTFKDFAIILADSFFK